MQFGIEIFYNINTTDRLTYGTGLNVCSCKNSIIMNQHHGHILTGDLQVIGNDKRRKLVSKGPNYRESKLLIGKM